MSRFVAVAVPLVTLLTAALSGAVQIPEYTETQFQDKDYVHAEIERYSQLRDDLVSKREGASPVVAMTLDKDLKRIDLALEALRYVEVNGYDPKDPELAKFEYFHTSLKPAETGFHHEMTPAGPRGGRVSFLDKKPVSREEAARKARPTTSSKPRPTPKPAPRKPR
jgi:hypothetical protein